MPTDHESSPTRGLRLTGLLATLPSTGVTVVSADSVAPEAADPLITSVTLDSRHVEPGALYAALPGANTHGARFAAQAAAAGAVAILTDDAGADLARHAGVALPIVVVADPRARLGPVSAVVHAHPAERLLLFGVTGTNGKTTTTYLVQNALTALGHRAGLIGTIETRIGTERLRSVRTTPESPELQALFAQMLDAGADACAMEISSHALALHRVDAVVVDVAGFTNLSQDHLDFHGTLENYFATKLALFTPEHSSYGVVCVDDEWGVRVAKEATVPVTTLRTRLLDRGEPAPDLTPDWQVTHCVPDPNGAGMLVTVRHQTGVDWQLVSPLPGDFNVANSCLAAVMLLRAGFDPDEIAAALAQAPGVPGRMQVVTADAPDPSHPLGIVDYAHGPESIATALAALRHSGSSPIVVVFGAGGDRDRGKRRQMGAAAVVGADAVIITDDNPRSEVPAEIRAELLEGAREAQPRHPDVVLDEIADRARAVRRGLELAVRLAGEATEAGRPTVLLAGKGHETGQEIAGTVHPFDDRLVLAEALGELPVPGATERTP